MRSNGIQLFDLNSRKHQNIRIYSLDRSYKSDNIHKWVNVTTCWIISLMRPRWMHVLFCCLSSFGMWHAKIKFPKDGPLWFLWVHNIGCFYHHRLLCHRPLSTFGIGRFRPYSWYTKVLVAEIEHPCMELFHWNMIKTKPNACNDASNINYGCECYGS